MGQEILYCFRCQTRIVGGDFERGDAYRVGEQVACGKCGMELLSKAPLEVQKQILEQKQKAIQAKEKKSSSPKLTAIPRGPTGSSTQVRSSQPWETASRAPIAILIGIGVTVVVLLGMLVMSSGSSAPAAPPPPPVSQPPRQPAPGPSAREIAAQAAFQVASSYAKDHPSHLEEQTKLFEKIVTDYANTPAGSDAKRELEKIGVKRKEAAAAERSALLAQARELTVGQEFQKAIDLLEGARKSHGESEWSQPIDARLKEIDHTMATEFPALRDQAVAARKNAANSELEAVRSKLARWNSARYSEELDKALSAAVAPVTAKASGTLMLRMGEASIVGQKLRRAGQGEWSILQGWNNPKDYVEWDVVSPRAGPYTLKMNYTCPKEFQGTPNGGEFSVTIGEETKTFTVEHTKTWGDYTDFPLGTMNLPAGQCKVTVRPVTIIHNLMSLRFVQLVPVK